MQRYQVVEGVQDGEQIFDLIDRETRSKARIVPGIGAQCASFTWENRGESLDILAPPENLKVLREQPVHYGNPILFPFPSRIKDGSFTFEGQTLKLPVNDTKSVSAIHGLALWKPWQAAGQGGGEDEGAWITCRLRTADFPDLEALYPFPYEISYTYRLRDGRLESEVSVLNTGEGPMPMGFGLHPWFPVPMSEKGNREACQISAPVSRVWELDGLIPTGRIGAALPERNLSVGVPLSDLELDDVYAGLNDGETEWSRSACTDLQTGVEIAVLADDAFRELVVYAPHNRRAVCLEPYTCAPNAFNLANQGIDAGMIVVPPGEMWSAKVVYAVRSIS